MGPGRLVVGAYRTWTGDSVHHFATAANELPPEFAGHRPGIQTKRHRPPEEPVPKKVLHEYDLELPAQAHLRAVGMVVVSQIGFVLQEG